MSNTNEERSPRFSRALLGRIIAIVLFVGLGTFAVIQSVLVDRAPEDHSHSAQDQTDSSSGNEPSITSNPALTTNPATQTLKPQVKPPPIGTATVGKLGQDQLEIGTGSAPNKANNPPPSISFAPQSPANLNTIPANKDQLASSIKQQSNELPPIIVANPAQTAAGNNAIPTEKDLSADFDSNSFQSRDQSSEISPSPNLAQRLSESFKKAAPMTSAVEPNGQQPLGNLANELRQDDTSVRPEKPDAQLDVSSSRLANQESNDSTFGGTQDSVAASAPGAETGFRGNQNPNAMFDSSRDLRPLSTSGQTNNERAGFNRRANIAESANEPAGTGLPAQSSLNRPVEAQPISTRIPAKPVASQPNSSTDFDDQSADLARAPDRSPAGSAASKFPSAMTAPVAGTGPQADPSVRTQATPGDQQLDGLQAPSLSIERLAPREIQLNQPAEFQLVVKNVGRIMAAGVQVFDQVPAGTQFVQAVPPPDGNSGGNIQWNLDTLKPGQEKRIKLQLKPIQPGEIGSVAYVTFSTAVSMRTKVTKPELEIHHTAEPQVLIGSQLVLDITVENKGDGPAHNVIIQEDVPAQLDFSDGFRELEYEIGTLEPGQSKRIRLSLKAAEVGRAKNELIVTGDGGLMAQHTIDIEVVAPQLSVSSSGPSRRYLQREAVHQFSIQNIGTAAATNVELIARLPSGLKFVNANNRGSYDPKTHAVYWSLAELAEGIQGSVELTTLPVDPGEQPIVFDATADLQNNASTKQELLVEHLVDVFFSIDDVVDPIEIGSDTAYRLRIENQGTRQATNVQIQVDFPPGIQPTGIEGQLGNEIRGQQVIFAPITSLQPGDEIALSVTAKGTAAGDHRVAVTLRADGRDTNVAKEESTRVYADR